MNVLLQSNVLLLARGPVTQIRADLDQGLQSGWSQVQYIKSSQLTARQLAGFCAYASAVKKTNKYSLSEFAASTCGLSTPQVTYYNSSVVPVSS